MLVGWLFNLALNEVGGGETKVTSYIYIYIYLQLGMFQGTHIWCYFETRGFNCGEGRSTLIKWLLFLCHR